MIHHLRHRWSTIRSFAAAGLGWRDKCALAIAGFARHRPFGDDSLYARLGRSLARQVTPRVSLADGQRIRIDLTSLVDPMIFEEIYVEHTYPIERVPFQPDLVIDCGACSGMFALLARAHFPASKIVALEPEPKNYSRLQHNIELNRARIETLPVAVGLQAGKVRFSGEGFGGHLATETEIDAITVDMISLPDLLKLHRPERLVLKMDIEGAEREILPAIAHLLPAQTVIFLETHHEESVCAAYLQPYLTAGFQHELIRHRQEADQVSKYVERLLIRNQAPVRYFCTYFDYNYCSLGLALYESLRRHCPSFQLWILCLNEEARAFLSGLALPHVHLISLAEFEFGDLPLQHAKTNRSLIEYYFTCTPSLPLFVLRQAPEADLVTYLDADLFFYADPAQVYSEVGTASIAIIGHRFSKTLGHMEENGIYNVGWLSFRRDANGLACLQWWREQCLAWCHMRHEPGRYADQKYLDTWPQRFQNVKVITHKGANLAMWNLANYRISRRADQVLIDGEPLLFFHFHGLRRPRRWIFSLNAPYYLVRPTPIIARHIFTPYVETLLAIETTHAIGAEPGCRLVPEEGSLASQKITKQARFMAHLLLNFLRRNYLIVRRGRIISAP